MIRKHIPLAAAVAYPVTTGAAARLRSRLVVSSAVDRPRAKRLRVFNIRPISVAWSDDSRAPAFKTLTANVAYIMRDASPSDRFGRMPLAFSERRAELRCAGVSLPASAPTWAAADMYAVWAAVDVAVDGMDDDVALRGWHMVLTVPPSMNAWCWKLLVETFVNHQFVRQGAPTAWAIHALAGPDGSWVIEPHAHIVVLGRRYRTTKAGKLGDRMPAWAGSRGRHAALRRAWETIVGPFLEVDDPG